jgi:hypothetical protein
MSKTLAPDRVKQICALHIECEGLARQTFDKAIIIGGLLAEAKADLGHGEWLPFVQANLPFTDRTARNYMRLHERRGELKSETVSDLTGAYRMLTEPKPPEISGEETAEVKRLLGSLKSNLEDVQSNLEDVQSKLTPEQFREWHEVEFPPENGQTMPEAVGQALQNLNSGSAAK